MLTIYGKPQWDFADLENIGVWPKKNIKWFLNGVGSWVKIKTVIYYCERTFILEQYVEVA